eukprot:4286387-Alexandrium_andersonii.AAC.1
MSASLVGSEMCIRDRSRHRYWMGSAGISWDLAADSRGAGLRLRAPRPRAVSYTHLTLPTICSV